MVNWKKIGWGLVIVDVVVLNLIGGYLLLRKNDGGGYFDSGFGERVTILDQCEDECRRQIKVETERLVAEMEYKQKIATPSAVPANLIAVTPTPSLRSVFVAPGVKPKVRSVQYVTIPGSGSSRAMNFEALSGTDFYFDKNDYPGLVEVYFEATINLMNGNGAAYVRLADITHGIGVDGSEVSSKSQTQAVVVSGRVNFWEGKNLYRVQIRTLTADTAVYNYGRLKIVTEN